jgi:hypothetical protein
VPRLPNAWPRAGAFISAPAFSFAPAAGFLLNARIVMRRLASDLMLLVTALFVAATPASAQYGGGRGGRRGGEEPSQLPAASTDPVRVAPTVAALVLAHGGDLQLSETQLARIESIRQVQDSANRPWMARLDSLRGGPRPVNPRDLSQEQRDAMAARRAAVADAMTGMRETNAEARQQVMAALNPDQQQKAAVLEGDAQKKTRDEAPRRPSEGFGGGRRGGGGMGRPPED